MRLIDAEELEAELNRRIVELSQGSDRSIVKCGMALGIQLAINTIYKVRTRKRQIIVDSKQHWQAGLPKHDGEYIVMYDYKLIEGCYYHGTMYGRNMAGHKLYRLNVNKIQGFVEWPEPVKKGQNNE